jgi:DNA polymerase III delta prime subunit
VVDFTLKSAEKAVMAKDFFVRIKSILQSEKIEYSDKVLAELIKKHFPDFRRVINELQRYSQFGKIDTGILTQISNVSITEIVKHMKDKDFGSVRKWVASGDFDSNVVFRQIYDALYDIMNPSSIPQAVLILADYQYKQSFVADGEINLVACLTELMVNAEFK